MQSISALGTARTGQPLAVEAVPRALNRRAFDDGHLLVVDRVSREVERYLAPPPDLRRGEALTALLKTDDVYATRRSTPVVSYDITKIRVCRADLTPKEIEDVVAEDIQRFIIDPDRWIVKSDEEILEIANSSDFPSRPYWDPQLRGSDANMKEFLKALDAAGLLTWRRRARAKVGFFFVAKKSGDQRLIVDARQANMMHQRAPHSDLAVPSALSRLVLSDEAVNLCERASERLHSAATNNYHHQPDRDRDHLKLWPNGSSADLTDGFYQFRCTRMASWFATDYVLKTDEISDLIGRPLNLVYDDDLQKETEAGAMESFYACFLGMPMGWAWALFFCHNAISAGIRAAQARLGMPTVLVSDRAPIPAVTRHAPVGAPYVDNANIIAVTEESGRLLYDGMLAELERIGFVLRDLTPPCSDFEFLGMVFDGERRTIRHSNKRCWRLKWALDDLLRRGGSTGECLRVLCGHLVHHFSLFPPALSILSRIFSFVQCNLLTWGYFDVELRKELIAARGMVFMCGQFLGRGVHTTAFCSDASMLGYALHESVASPAEVLSAAAWKERWRFVEYRPPVDHRPHGVPSEATSVAWLAGPESAFEKYTLALAAQHRRERGPRRKKEKKPRELVEVTGLVPSLPNDWAVPARWRLVVRGAWRHSGAIHCHEGRTAVMGLRRASRCADAHDKIVLSLGDNASELLTQEKGRATDFQLNNLCRVSCGLQAGTGIAWRRRHIETDRNCSDYDSRAADRGELLPGQVEAPAGAARAQGWRRAEAVAAQSECKRRHAAGVASRLTPPPGAQLPPPPPPPAPLPPEGRPAAQPRRWALELFSGCARLTAAWREATLAAGPHFDILNGHLFDLTNSRILAVVLEWIAKGSCWLVHLGTPCTVWSVARTSASSTSSTAMTGRACARAAVQVLRAARLAGTYVVHENPKTSALYQWPPMARELKRLKCDFIQVDMCRFGAPFQKSGLFASNLPNLRSYIGLLCTCTQPHLRLQGTATLEENGRRKSVWLTSLAGRYPPALCRAYAACARASAPTSAISSDSDDGRLVARLLERLAAAAGGHAEPLPAPRCPRRFECGWEYAIKSWGTSVPACHARFAPGARRRGDVEGAGRVRDRRVRPQAAPIAEPASRAAHQSGGGEPQPPREEASSAPGRRRSDERPLGVRAALSGTGLRSPLPEREPEVRAVRHRAQAPRPDLEAARRRHDPLLRLPAARGRQCQPAEGHPLRQVLAAGAREGSAYLPAGSARPPGLHQDVAQQRARPASGGGACARVQLPPGLAAPPRRPQRLGRHPGVRPLYAANGDPLHQEEARGDAGRRPLPALGSSHRA